MQFIKETILAKKPDLTPLEWLWYRREAFTTAMELAYLEAPDEYNLLVEEVRRGDLRRFSTYGDEINILVPSDFDLDGVTDDDYPILEKTLIDEDLDFAEVGHKTPLYDAKYSDEDVDAILYLADRAKKIKDLTDEAALNESFLNPDEMAPGDPISTYYCGPSMLKWHIGDAFIRLYHGTRTQYIGDRGPMNYTLEMKNSKELEVNQRIVDEAGVLHYGRPIKLFDTPGLLGARRLVHAYFIFFGAPGYFHAVPRTLPRSTLRHTLSDQMVETLNKLVGPLSVAVHAAESAYGLVNFLEMFLHRERDGMCKPLFDHVRDVVPTMMHKVNEEIEAIGMPQVTDYWDFNETSLRLNEFKVNRKTVTLMGLYPSLTSSHGRCHESAMKAAKLAPAVGMALDNWPDLEIHLFAKEFGGVSEYVKNRGKVPRYHTIHDTDLEFGSDDLIVVDISADGYELYNWNVFGYTKALLKTLGVNPGVLVLLVNPTYLQQPLTKDGRPWDWGDVARYHLGYGNFEYYKIIKTGRLSSPTLTLIASRRPPIKGEWDRNLDQFSSCAYSAVRIALYSERVVAKGLTNGVKVDLKRRVSKQIAHDPMYPMYVKPGVQITYHKYKADEYDNWM